MASLAVERSEISRSEASFIWHFYLRELRTNLAILIFVMTVCGFGVSNICMYFIFKSDSLIAYVIAGTATSLCFAFVVGLSFMKHNLQEIRCLWRDLKSKSCELITVRASDAFRFRISNATDELDAIAIECGRYTFVIIGREWTAELRPDISWTPPMAWTTFPSTHFRVRRLPSSGRIVSVEVLGTKLKLSRRVKKSHSFERGFSTYMDCFYTEESLCNQKE